ncbi:hypothetical protein NDN01_19595 [Sphingomonas sp. QA11]|uniref:hypothetical protein n=1 Tax=Sphingomonas sp. QA11 TaxID=2950605 RepID=UPI00234C0222|nr:hypothetical protein [Sphingomonas sp. QA11]WCM26190.1 hypothetical protein NDN01_19595 [Sphingomonas sp. QA11]
MRAFVTRIGTDFEFHRANFNKDSRDAASTAPDRLYALFDVSPVRCRALHDGRSPIVATADRWQDRHQQLWVLLVPSSGAAASVQGEVIRISGRIADELDGNGGANWDAQYRAMADAWLAHVGSGKALPPARTRQRGAGHCGGKAAERGCAAPVRARRGMGGAEPRPRRAIATVL